MRININPAIPGFIASGSCLLELAGAVPPFSAGLMTLQFIVIHSSWFMFGLPLTLNEKNRPVIFYGLLAAYSAIAFSAGGAPGVVQFAGLTYATYYGYVFHGGGAQGRVPLALRWLAAFVFYAAAIVFSGLPDSSGVWVRPARAALSGAVYFAALGAMELSGFYETGW